MLKGVDDARADVLRQIRDRASENTGTGIPFQHELRKAYTKWLGRFQRKANEQTQRPKYRWTEAKYLEYLKIPPETFILDKYFLGLEGEVYPAHLKEIINAFNYWRDGKIKETVDISAVGVGKTWKAGILSALLTIDTLIHPDPAEAFGLAPRTKLGMVIMSRNAKLAKEVTFMQLLPFFDCDFFMDYFPPQVNISLVEETRQYPALLRFPKRFAISPETGSYLSILGYNLVFALMDEFAWMEKVRRSTKSALGFAATEYDAAFESYTAIENRIFSRTYAGTTRGGLMIMITQPRTKYDFAETKYKEGLEYNRFLEGVEEAKATINAPYWRNPTDEEKERGFTRKIYVGTQKQIAGGKKIYGMKRKPMWRARPQFWKGRQQWSGEYLLFDPKNMIFRSDEIYEGLFDNEEDYDDEGLFKVPVELVERFKAQPLRAYRDLGAQATAGIHRFFGDLAKVNTRDDLPNYVIIREGRPVTLDTNYYADRHPLAKPRRFGHADLAQNKDIAAAATCFCSGWKYNARRKTNLPIATFDWLTEIKARPGNVDIRVEDVFDLFVEMQSRGFDVGLVSYDGFQSLHSIQRLWDDHNIPSGRLSIDRTTQRLLIASVNDYAEYGVMKRGVANQPLAAWEELLEGFYDGRILCPSYERDDCSLLQQIEQEEYYGELRGGLGVVDHPPGGKHDLLQCIAGAYWNMLNNEWWTREASKFMEDEFGELIPQGGELGAGHDSELDTGDAKALKQMGF